MKGVRAFLDTNFIIYLYSEDEPKKQEIAQGILNRHYCVISTQIMNEASNVWFKKYGWSGIIIEQHLDNIENICDFTAEIQRRTINKAIMLKERYNYSYYDCLMLASALENNCDFLYSEDMNDGQIIENKLRIVNPFICQQGL
jgi:predicted nucleic acid-binding protein